MASVSMLAVFLLALLGLLSIVSAISSYQEQVVSDASRSGKLVDSGSALYGSQLLQYKESSAMTLQLLRHDLELGLKDKTAAGFQFAILDWNASKLNVLQNPDKYNALVVVVAEGGAPVRRTELQPFLTADPASLLPTSAINKAAQILEGALGRRLYSYEVKLVKFSRQQQHSSRWAGAYVVFDVSSGEVLVDSEAVKGSWTSTVAGRAIARVVGPMFKFMAEWAKQAGAPEKTVTHLLNVLREYWPELAGLAMVFKVPLWFCALCPAILGLAMPLLINGGLGLLAHEVCTHFHMSDEQCMEMWYGAFALGFLLSMASAVPIFYVCHLYQCEHPSSRPAKLLTAAWRRMRF